MLDSVRGAGFLSIGRIWHGLRSMTFAIIMLLAILCIVIAGSFLPQDSGIRLVYESWWFYSLNGLLMLSILSCVSRRFRGVVRFSFHAPVVHRPEFYRSGDTACALSTQVPVERASSAAVSALRSCGYRVEVMHVDGGAYVLADRFRVMRMGTLVSHLSIVLLVVSIIWGAFAGWLDKSVQLEAGGAAVPIGHGTGLLLRSDSFNFGLYPDGTPRNFQDHLTVIENNGGGREHHQVIDVNEPWYYGGVFGYDIHQADYGVAARLIAVDTTQASSGVLPYCALQLAIQQCTSPTADITALPSLLLQPLGDGSYQPVGSDVSAFYLPAQDLAVTLDFHDAVPEDNLPATAVVTVAKPPQTQGQSMQVLREALDDPITTRVFDGRPEMITSQPIDIGHVRIALLIWREAFVNIGHNPAVPFIFASCGLVLLGLVSVLYFPFSRLWLYISSMEGGAGSVLLLRGSAEKSKQGFKRRFAQISRKVQQAVVGSVWQ